MQASGSAAQRLAASGACKVSASPATATSQAGSSSPFPELVACYSLAVGSVELGGHPSHVPMVGVLVDQVFQELMLLMRDAPDMTAAGKFSNLHTVLVTPHVHPSCHSWRVSSLSCAVGPPETCSMVHHHATTLERQATFWPGTRLLAPESTLAQQTKVVL